MACVQTIYSHVLIIQSFHRNAASADEIDEPQNQNYNTFQDSLLDYASNKDN